MSIYNGLEYACLFGLNAQARGEGITGDVARRERADKGMVGAAVARKQRAKERWRETASAAAAAASWVRRTGKQVKI